MLTDTLRKKNLSHFSNRKFMCRLIKYNKEEYARIGIMPRYGDSDSIRWFEVQPNYTFHIINCFEDDEEVNYRISVLKFCLQP
jgi:carotenoid cleavage dioxygenase-like enzyme